MFEHDGHRARVFTRWRLHADGDTEIGGHRQIDRHLDAADGAPHHDALARELDGTDALVGGPVTDRKTQGKGEGVEPLDAARPGRRYPADGCLTPQVLAPRRACP